LIVSGPKKRLVINKDLVQTASASMQMVARVLNILFCVFGETDWHVKTAMEQYNSSPAAPKTCYS